MKKTLLYEACTITRKPPVNHPEIRETSAAFIRLEETLDACYLCEIKNAFVSPYGIVFKNGRVVKESVYSMFTNNRNAPTFYKKLLLGKVRRVAGDCLAAHNAYYDNYYHWTLEALPRIFSVRHLTPNLKLLIHEKTPPFVDAYLSYFDFKEIVRIKDDEIVWSENLFLPMHTARGLAHRESVVRKMADHFKSKTPYNGTDFKGFDKVYLSRYKAKYRKIINEDVVLPVLEEHGFKRIMFEDFTIQEQINLMRNVRVFFGVHGAGFSNIIYMNIPEIVVNFIFENHYDPAFYNLACAINVSYMFIQCKGLDNPKGVAYADLTIDPLELTYGLNLLKKS